MLTSIDLTNTFSYSIFFTLRPREGKTSCKIPGKNSKSCARRCRVRTLGSGAASSLTALLPLDPHGKRSLRPFFMVSVDDEVLLMLDVSSVRSWSGDRYFLMFCVSSRFRWLTRLSCCFSTATIVECII